MVANDPALDTPALTSLLLFLDPCDKDARGDRRDLRIKVARALKAGTVWINCYGAGDTGMPFGGYKQSGFGRENGRHALDLFTQVKSVYVKL